MRQRRLLLLLVPLLALVLAGAFSSPSTAGSVVTVVVTPDSDLPTEATVAVDVTGLVADGVYYLFECDAGGLTGNCNDADGSSLEDNHVFTADGSGNASEAFAVAALFHDDFQGTDNDCSFVDCFVFVVEDGTFETVGSAQIRFAPFVTEPTATTTTVGVTKTSKNVKVAGLVAPDRPAAGESVTVKLLRKKGDKFRILSTKQAALTESPDGTPFSTKFGRPKAGKCKVVATYAGNEDYLASSASKRFAC